MGKQKHKTLRKVTVKTLEQSCPYCGQNTVKLVYRRRLNDRQYIDRLQCGACRRVFLDRHVEDK